MTQRTIHSKYLFKDNSLPEGFHNPIIVGYDIRTPENIGSIIRLADNIACQKVLFISDEDNVRLSKIKKTAASSFASVDWEFCKFEDLKNKLPSDYKLIALETTSDSTNIFKNTLPEKMVLIVGNEVTGIENRILDLCDSIVHIPIYGKNTSLNVSHSVAIALFQWQNQILNLK